MKFVSFSQTLKRIFGEYVPPLNPSHPPTFSDFKRIREGTWRDAKRQKEITELFRAAALVPDEIDRLCIKGGVSEYVGAGALAPIDDWHGFEVLKKATEQFPDNLLVWFAFAYRYFRLKREDRLAGDEEHDFDYILTELSALDFTNSVPLYLRAAVVVYKEDLSLARNLIADATLKPLFVTHEAGIRRCIAHSAESIDYPLFTARAVALLYGEIPGVLNGLGKTLCNDLMSTAETIRHCLVMGRRLEEASQFIIANIAALGIQSVAIRRLPARGEVVDLARIQERSTALQAAADYLDSAHLRQMDEERWVNYFDKVFASTEEQAVNELSAEHGKS